MLLRLLKVPPEPPAPFGDEQTVLVFRAAPAYYQYKLLLWMVGALFTLCSIAFGFAFIAVEVKVADFFHLPPGVRVFILVATIGGIALTLVGLGFSLVKLRLDYELRWYKMTDRSVRIREGVVALREMTMTFANIQNTSISQGPLQRLLGIADVKLETAGGGGGGAINEQQAAQQPHLNMHTAWFRGVDNAEFIRDLVRERMRMVKGAGLGDHDDEHDSPTPTDSVAIDPALVAALRAEAVALRQAAQRLVP
jgi:membrane protein YdbS with pleckstrin-like domain